MIRAVFFDFDGVIIDSSQIKTDAFYELFLEFGEERALYAKQYHLENQGVDRFKKLRYIFSHILNFHYSKEIEIEYSSKFSNIVFDKIIQCDFLPGIIKFLECLGEYSVKSFLLSATPEPELRKICLMKKVDFYFSKICGSPISKEDHGETILKDFLFPREKIIFFGDSHSDLHASRKLKTNFIGVAFKNRNIFPENIPTISDFREIDGEKFIYQ